MRRIMTVAILRRIMTIAILRIITVAILNINIAIDKQSNDKQNMRRI